MSAHARKGPGVAPAPDIPFIKRRLEDLEVEIANLETDVMRINDPSHRQLYIDPVLQLDCKKNERDRLQLFLDEWNCTFLSERMGA